VSGGRHHAREDRGTYSRVGVVVAIVVLGACASARAERESSPATTRPAPEVSTTSSTITTTTDRKPPARVHDLVVSPVPAPQVFVPRAQWLRIARPDGVVQYAAVYRPPQSNPLPVVVYLHGSTGLEDLELDWAARLAERGFVVVAGCYLDAPASARFVRCPTLPLGEPTDPSATKSSYDALMAVAAALPGVRPGPVGVVGVSYGAIAALSIGDARVGAIVADSGYGKKGVQPVRAPVLMLAWTDDGHVSHTSVVWFEASLDAANKPVTAQYYEGMGHVATLDPGLVGVDATNRAADFLRRSLA
jgi:dienelactone hydrolase